MKTNKIYNENCLDTMKNMSDNFVDIVVTSPPYNIGKSRGNTNRIDVQYDIYSDDLELQEYFNQTKLWIDELLRVTKHYVFWNIGEYSVNKGISGFIMNTYKENLKENFIWIKTNPNPVGRNIVCNSYEYIFCLVKENAVRRKYDHNNFGDNMIKNYIIKPVNNSKQHGGHGYAFGEWLPKHFIHNFSKEGETIYDPFMGSGTTAVAAYQLDRKFIGSEISEKYIDIANKRLQPYLNQTKLF